MTTEQRADAIRKAADEVSKQLKVVTTAKDEVVELEVKLKDARKRVAPIMGNYRAAVKKLKKLIDAPEVADKELVVQPCVADNSKLSAAELKPPVIGGGPTLPAKDEERQIPNVPCPTCRKETMVVINDERKTRKCNTCQFTWSGRSWENAGPSDQEVKALADRADRQRQRAQEAR